ncbi:ADAMTS-like protein 1 [Octopus sinensis]|uniref:ADAMTS-like protein 1 n=1 Tax=Octopus sinensis TaxID=2607531 RepID=A0A6P7T885_9MOLL|nr:ADAMTS-like protein 1 [Octopus sinensis]
MTCGGGTSLREVSCMEYGPSGQARWVEDQFCKQLQPSEYKSCNTDICPRWYAGEWSPCSVTCGFGIQHRVVICRNSGNNTCEEEEKPTTSQTCTTNLPCFERSGDIQETLLTDYIESSPPKYGLAPNISKLDLSAPRFIPYDWSPCSVTCGTGVKTRRVPCKIFLQFLNEVTEVPHKECIDAGEEKPVSSMECNVGICLDHGSGTIDTDNSSDYRTYVWKLTDFTFSSDNNVEEIKKPLRLSCYDAIRNSEVNQTLCPAQPILYLFNKWCSSESMCFGWYNLDEYTPCQPTCGDSTQQRLVACVEEGTQGDKRQFSAVANKFCLNPMPKMLKVCISSAECPARWGIGSWEKCSVSCNGGLQRRWLGCQKVLPDGNLVNVSDTECADIPRQRSIRVCNSFPCQKPRIKEPVKKFFQLTHSMAINIFTGSHAYVLPATVLTVRCLTRGIDRSSIRWFRNGKPLVPFTDLRVNYSRNSLHRIKVQTPSTPNQSENYTCRCNTIYNNVSRTLESTVVLHLISLIDILRETAHRESYLLGTVTSPYANVTDPADKRPRRAYYVSSQWSSCTASTCKRYGRQTRNVSCEIITTNYFEELPAGVCKRGRLKRPEVKRKCRMDCFKWITYEWGKAENMAALLISNIPSHPFKIFVAPVPLFKG